MWKWIDDADGSTETELVPAEANHVGECDSILRHNSDWHIRPEHKAMIAAAPDLLEACKAAMVCLESSTHGGLREAREVLTAAIARAEGREVVG